MPLEQGPGATLAYFNLPQETANGFEIGPLATIQNGPFQGDGMVIEKEAIAFLFEMIDALPVTDQARLVANQFAATMLELDIDANGTAEPIFLTMEFPLAGKLVRDRVDPLSGAREIRIYEGGRWKRSITNRRIVEITTDDDLVESSSQVFVNEGTIEDPKAGALLEETRTTEVWFRDWSRDDSDPNLPVISKIRVNYVTGSSIKEVYGLYPRPIEIVDEQFVSTIELDSSGLMQSSQVYANGKSEADLARPLIERLLEPVQGELRYRNHTADGTDLDVLQNNQYRLEVRREDVLKGTSKQIIMDLARGGRILSELIAETLPGAGPVTFQTRHEYREDFHYGFLPVRSEQRTGPDGATLWSATTIKAFDPLTRRLTGEVVDHTGKATTVVWDARWESPVEIASSTRRTTIAHDQRELSFRAETTSQPDGQVLSAADGVFEPGNGVWSVKEKYWYQPEVPLREETSTRSPAGHLLATRSADGLEHRVEYAADGTAKAGRTYLKNGAGEDVLIRQETGFLWQDGTRRAEVTTYLDGNRYDRFSTFADADGRVVEDQIKDRPELKLKTVREFDGNSERVTRAVTMHNGKTRTVFIPGEPSKNNDGMFHLPVVVTPDWGMVRTDYFELGGEHLGPLRTVFENGETSRALETFPGLDLAHRTQRQDREGTAVEETVLQPSDVLWAELPLDLLQRYELGPSGSRRLVEERGLLRGTEIPVYSDHDDRRIYFDLDQLAKVPRYEIDLTGTTGAAVVLDAEEQSHVTRLFRSKRNNWQGEPAMLIESIDMRGFFSLLHHQRVYDRSGTLVEEQVKRLPNQQSIATSGHKLFDAAMNHPTEQILKYRFKPGAARSDLERIEVFDAGKAGTPPSLAYELADPKTRDENLFLPDHVGPWSIWTTLAPGPDGTRRLLSQSFFDGRDRPAVTTSMKNNARGQSATRVSYDLRTPDSWKTQELSPGANAIELPLDGQPDLSACHFIAFGVQPPELINHLALELRDASGKQLRITPAGKGGDLRFWPGDGETVQWLPKPTDARAAASVRADFPGTLLVSVPELGAAGFDLEALHTATLHLESTESLILQWSSLRRLATWAPLPASSQDASTGVSTIAHSSGLRTVSPAPATGPATEEEEMRTDPYWNSEIRFQDATIAKVRPRKESSDYPIIIVQDPSSPTPRPLYALVAESGEFLEYYHRVPVDGDTRVYTIAGGFRPPRVEVFRGGILEDESSPGVLAIGESYEIELPLSRTSKLHNRIASSIFKLGADLLDPASRSDDHPDPKSLHHANEQVEQISKLPTFAEALLPFREVPWGEPENPDEPEHDCSNELFATPQAMAAWFASEPGPAPPTPLYPTSPDTSVETFVDTIEEAQLIEAAMAAGEFEAAAKVLDFYWEKSRAGSEALHTSYDLRTGASHHLEPQFLRPSESPRTAAAQLAVAEAALSFAEATRDHNAWELGRSLLQLLLIRYRAPDQDEATPRGISEQEHRPRIQRLGTTLWPDPAEFTLHTNARALLALKRSVSVAEIVGESASDWIEVGTQAAKEQGDWLRAWFSPRVEENGIVPNGLFEIQDLYTKTSAFAVSRWTSASAWMSYLEAAESMGVPREVTHRSLEVLARVHGARVGDLWGLDWSVALTRPEAISPDLTARFFKIARQLDHQEAAMFARHQLSALGAEKGEPLPKVITVMTPTERLPTGQNRSVYPLRDQSAWPRSLAPYRHLTAGPGPLLSAVPQMKAESPGPRDLKAFLRWVALYYLSILLVAVLWWIIHARRRKDPTSDLSNRLVSDPVMAAAEKRWAERVVGVLTPDGAPNTRYANGPVEANFIMQLRAIYKLVLEWRRLENKREEDDPELSTMEDDRWLNGMDEFASMAALYMRYIIKAGLKDGFHKDDVFEDPEDSNHIWSRLVLYFSEYYSGLLTLLQQYHRAEEPKDFREVNQQIFLLLNTAGIRQRKTPFDTRTLFNFPENEDAFDLLIIQKQGTTLQDVASSMEKHLGIPERQLKGFVKRFKDFKHREKPYPVHPLVLEAAKVFPHFVLVGLLGILWYNSEVAGLPVLPFLAEAIQKLGNLHSLLWALPLLAGYSLSVVAYYMKFLRYESGMTSSRPLRDLLLPVRNLIRKPSYVLPLIKPGKRWDPTWYERIGYLLRGVGFFLVGLELLKLPTPSFAVFMILKGVLALLLLLEAAAIFLPLAGTWLSMWLQERVTRGRKPWRFTRFLNQLNIPATRPASVVWQALVYHYQISVPSGSRSSFIRAIVLYFGFAAIFLAAGGYVFKEVLAVWFAETYQIGYDVRLLIGGFVFFNTMYLMRFGIFVLLSGIAAALATYPLKIGAGLATIILAIAMLSDTAFTSEVASRPTLAWTVAILIVGLVSFEGPLAHWLKRLFAPRRDNQQKSREQALEAYRQDDSRTLGIVYMSGDELGFRKLNPDLLMDRIEVLRDRLDSAGLREVNRILGSPDDQTLRTAFEALYQAEESSATTLWHPSQLVVAGEDPVVPGDLELNIVVPNAKERDRLLGAWHCRRWLVSMMSSAGHSQDTAINLVDIALRISREGLSERTVFYLIQNKYDARDDNRPGQMNYGSEELGQREKLTRLLTWASPGSRAFSLNDWTPFGFKAGGMMGMDLVHEESLKLTNMVVLDRNATVHDLDALTEDIYTAISDPGVVIVIPGRGTTNTRTHIGQGSQAMEEGHRELIKGVMLMGGEAGESVGTGWGNIQAIYYGRTQRAMMDGTTRRLPLTTRMRRGSTFVDRLEGMVGFGPHAVGISEDIWAVIQAAHNAVSLGIRVKFKRSKAMWHKIRETWSHADWFSAFPRWSGGFLQMMQDPLMQRISDNGPLSVFAKEVRANNGRFFFCAPFALLSILIMPLAIILDASPFVQILIVLWNAGFIMNQVLTSLGLVATLEATGFSRLAGLAGAAAGGVLAIASGWFSPAVCALATVAGLITGGFMAGFGRWLYNRGRDIILFGPQLVIFALGQFVRQSLEFVLSGAAADDAKGVNIAFRSSVGPREDRPLAGYTNPVNMRSVVWIIGGLSMALNLFALTNLDFLNVVLLLPSLLFGVSCVAGPFLMRPKRGVKVGPAVVLPKVLGWTTGLVFFLLVAAMVAQGGRFELLAAGLGALFTGWLALNALRFVRFPRQLRKARLRVARRLRTGGPTDRGANERLALASVLLQSAEDSPAVVRTLKEAGFEIAQANEVADYLKSKVAPILQRPARYSRPESTVLARLLCEYRRSLALSLLTFVWFLIVPVPALLTFTAGDYRIALSVMPFVFAVLGAVAAVLAFALLGLIVERLCHLGPGKLGLQSRVESTWHRFRAQSCSSFQTASVFALFTDLQTYLDQRAYAYARRTLDQIENKLDAAQS